MYYGDFPPYVSVAERRRRAKRAMDKRRKAGHDVTPVTIDGRVIAHTFWGKAWCQNLEQYSDFANRLPRGRTYVRNGSVVDLQIAPGRVSAWVSGSELYEVTVKVARVAKAHWASMCADSAGAIDSLVELLQGRFAKGVMERLCRQRTGLFPSPRELEFSCSCPDWASMCKHVAAVFYGIGSRLDDKPELLFKLRQVEAQDLLATAATNSPLSGPKPSSSKVLVEDDLSGLFGLEFGDGASEAPLPALVSTKKRKSRAKPGTTKGKGKQRKSRRRRV